MIIVRGDGKWIEAAVDSVWSRIRHGIESSALRSPRFLPNVIGRPRQSFVAGIHLTDLQSEKHLAAHIENLNLLGCFVETATPFAKGTKVRLKISHDGVNFAAIGKVAYSVPNSGMGIAFITIDAKSQEVIDLWLANLRK